MAPETQPEIQTPETNFDSNVKVAKAGRGPKLNLLKWARNRFFTGVIVAIPIVATLLAVSWVVTKIDENVFRIIPNSLNPETYLGVAIPGLGIIISIILLFLLGILASNFIGKSLLRSGEKLLGRVPVVSPIYKSLKQIVETVAAQRDRAFRDVCLIEYPKKDVWAIGFVTADLSGKPAEMLGDNMVCVFVPTTPNPTSGFLLFVRKDTIQILDMTPEEGAKMIISGGMVSSSDMGSHATAFGMPMNADGPTPSL